MIGKIIAAIVLLVTIGLAGYEVVRAQSPTATPSPTATGTASPSPVPTRAPQTGYGIMAN